MRRVSRARELLLVSLALSASAAAYHPRVLADCGEPGVPLAAVALGESEHARPGSQVVVEGTVTAAFLGDDRLNGFYLAQDGERPAGLFVYAPELEQPLRDVIEPGVVLRLNGRVGRYQGQRQLEYPRWIRVCGRATPVEPVSLELPATGDRLSRLDGLPVRLRQPLTVIDNHDLGHYGSLTLSARGRLFAGEPLPPHARLILDDASHATNSARIPYLDAQGTRRVGSRLSAVTGILASTFGRYRVHPTDAPRWSHRNPRRAPAGPQARSLRVAVFNIQNYFARLGSRGAETAAQRALQRRKLVAAIGELDADVLALLELGNSAAAVTGLIDAVNDTAAERDRYRTVLEPRKLGDDAIRAVLAYRPARLRLVGEPRSHGPDIFERPLILARFQAPGRQPLSVVAAHFKSKGGCPGGQRAANRVAGCWGKRREAQARALLDAMGGAPLGAERWLVLADLNAYSRESPLAILESAGLVNPVERQLPPGERYTYVYQGHSGTLDYVLASESLAEEIGQVQIWHANADEPPFLSYGAGHAAAAADAGAYRASDHDPVMVDLEAGR